MKIGEKVRVAAESLLVADAKLDVWVRQHPKLEKDLDEAAQAFAEARTHRFGWRRFAKVLAEELPDFPVGYQHLQVWMTKRYPELFRGDQ